LHQLGWLPQRASLQAWGIAKGLLAAPRVVTRRRWRRWLPTLQRRRRLRHDPLRPGHQARWLSARFGLFQPDRTRDLPETPDV